MKLFIDSQMRPAELRQAFRKWYPYLVPRLDTATPGTGQRTGNVSEQPLRTHAGREFACVVDISRKATVASVEESFRRLCGLGIRILRRGPFDWEDIPDKETHCLDQENHMGRVVTRGMYEPELLL